MPSGVPGNPSATKAEITALVTELRDPTLTLAAFVEAAFARPFVERVDVYKFKAGEYTATKLDQLKPGFDPSAVEQHILGLAGPGRYSLRPAVDGHWRGQREFPLGDFDDSELPRPGQRVARAETANAEISPDQVLRDLAAELKAEGNLGTLEGLRSDREINRLTRMMMVMNMSERLGGGKRDEGAGVEARQLLHSVLEAQLRRNETLEARLLEAAKAPAPLPPSPGMKELLEQFGAFGKAAEAFGFAKTTARAAATTVWDGVAKVAEFLGPSLDRAFALAERAIESRAVVPAGQTAAAVRTAITAGGAPVPKAEIPPEILEAANLLLEYLRSRDFESAYTHLQFAFPDIEINPKAQASVYAFALRRINPEFDKVRAELGEFLAWYGKRIADEESEDKR